MLKKMREWKKLILSIPSTEYLKTGTKLKKSTLYRKIDKQSTPSTQLG